jgi:hypothetical protein
LIPLFFVRPKGPGLVDQPRIDCIAAAELGKRSGLSTKKGPAAGSVTLWLGIAVQRRAKGRISSRIKQNCDSRRPPAVGTVLSTLYGKTWQGWNQQ